MLQSRDPETLKALVHSFIDQLRDALIQAIDDDRLIEVDDRLVQTIHHSRQGNIGRQVVVDIDTGEMVSAEELAKYPVAIQVK